MLSIVLSFNKLRISESNLLGIKDVFLPLQAHLASFLVCVIMYSSYHSFDGNTDGAERKSEQLDVHSADIQRFIHYFLAGHVRG